MVELFLYPQVVCHFQQDGAPPYWNLNVWIPLNDTFQDSWIGHSRSIWWLCSLELILQYFLLWNYMRELVFITLINDLPHLWNPTVPMDMSERMCKKTNTEWLLFM